ncbi:MAG: nitroreductase family protein [Muribaculaceae bacterium]|nr:nitroreductase family protein [Muribaculaceae bacterium]
MTFDELRDLMISNRTVRRFNQSKAVSTDTLRQLVELTRYCPSGRNAQPLRYLIINDSEGCDKIFPLLKWAGYFHDWDGPSAGERPSAYLVQCMDTDYGKNPMCDDGLQLEAITLGLHTLGMAGCIIKAFNIPELTKSFNLGEKYVPQHVLAIGYPAEEVVIEDIPDSPDSDFKYFRTADGRHHVPKRQLSSLII